MNTVKSTLIHNQYSLILPSSRNATINAVNQLVCNCTYPLENWTWNDRFRSSMCHLPTGENCLSSLDVLLHILSERVNVKNKYFTSVIQQKWLRTHDVIFLCSMNKYILAFMLKEKLSLIKYLPHAIFNSYKVSC